jgi:TolA-binding protein
MFTLFKKAFTLTLALCLLAGALFMPTPEAFAKGKKATPKALATAWEPYAPKVTDLIKKSRNRRLFTPQDSETLNDIQQASAEIQERFQKLPDMAPILYQLGVLYSARDMWFEAYDAFATISSRYPKTSYAGKARFQLTNLRQRVGEDRYAALEASSGMTSPMAMVPQQVAPVGAGPMINTPVSVPAKNK